MVNLQTGAGTLVVKYLIREVGGEGAELESMDGNVVQRIPCLRPYYLFNLDQIEGLDRPVIKPKALPSDQDKVEAIKDLVAMRANSGLSCRRIDNQTCYPLTSDALAMPAVAFESEEHYASTLTNELVHATMHPHRLGRHARRSPSIPIPSTPMRTRTWWRNWVSCIAGTGL